MRGVAFILLIIFTTMTTVAPSNTSKLKYSGNNSFMIDYENDQFLLDGKPFRYVSGSFHYFRTPRQYWRGIFKKMRAAGLNAISTYIEWSTHEPEPGKWIWNGDADIIEFLKIAEEEDLLVILRPGPYICAERDFGGLPTWLLSKKDIKLRTNDRWYMKNVQKYLETVLKKVKPFLRGNGGPIIMVQVENEYGSFNACDIHYRTKLRDIFAKHIESNAVLFTTDGPQLSMLRCGVIPEVFATVDFGPSSNGTKSFEMMRKFQPRGPLVNSEYYPGWLTHWGESLQKVSSLNVVKTLDEILSIGASVNIYMFFGGTNFGFKSGANTDPEFRPQLTSYDYDAPLTEAGDLTPKYFAMRDVIKSYLPVNDLPIPADNKKKAYGVIILEQVIRLFDPLAQSLLSSIVVQTDRTPTFEELQIQQLQLVLYETYLNLENETLTTLKTLVHDRAYVYINKQLIGILSRMEKKYNLPINTALGNHLSLLVVNEGHVNYGDYLKDYKGLLNVSLGEETSLSWNVTGFTLDNVTSLCEFNSKISVSGCVNKGPIFYRATFFIKEDPVDTYLDTSGWGKGVAYINGYNIGRYWPLNGPQITLYVPGVILKHGSNELIILEYEYASKSLEMKFINTPKFITNKLLENDVNNCNLTDNV